MTISDAQNQRFNAVLWLTAALSSNTWGVMCHFQTNSPFSYRLGSSSAKVKAPVQHRGCWKHTTAPLFREFLLEWTRFGSRLLFSFSCCSWGSFFPSSLLLPRFHRPYAGRWFCEWNHAYPRCLYDGNDKPWRNNGREKAGIQGLWLWEIEEVRVTVCLCAARMGENLIFPCQLQKKNGGFFKLAGKIHFK